MENLSNQSTILRPGHRPPVSHDEWELLCDWLWRRLQPGALAQAQSQAQAQAQRLPLH